jgi:DHA1 family multidrug resistance protein-like MFS transporter
MHWKKNLIILWSANFISYGSAAVLAPIFPFFIESIGITDPAAVNSWTGYLWAAMMGPAVFAFPFWGSVGDRYGHKKMIMRAMMGAGIVLVLTSRVTSVYQLLGLRVLHGFFGGFMLACQAYMTRCTPKEKIGYVFGILQTSMIAGWTIGPVFGGFLADLIGFRPIFLSTGCIHFLSGCIVLFTIPVDRIVRDNRPKPALRSRLKIIFGNPMFLLMSLVRFLTDCTTTLIMPLLPIFIHGIIGSESVQATKIGFVMTMAGVATVVGAALFGRLGDKTNHKWVLTTCMLGSALLYIPHAMATGYTQVVFLRFLVGVFSAGMIPSIMAIIVLNTREDQRGLAIGLCASFSMLGGAVGSMAGPQIVNAWSFSTLFYVIAAIFAASWILTVLKVKKEATFTYSPQMTCRMPNP